MPAAASGKVLVDSNVLIDVVQQDPTWFDWSAKRLREVADAGRGVINPIIYAEVSVGFDTIEEFESAIALFNFERQPLPWPAAFLAGKAYVLYRKRGGRKGTPLPDFYVGAHAALGGLALLTRDARRYREYFPRLTLIAPR
ncbi:MAG: type II toxin-antitoxin system VapC family toxin [Pseudomonadota bacterium]